jgi:kynurenine formamidase
VRKGVAGVVVDTLSLDDGASKDFAFHYKWLGSGH